MDDVASVLRAFRTMLRSYFDAQEVDWGDEANAPRFAELQRFVDEHDDYRAALRELLLCVFLLPDPGVAQLMEALASRMGPDHLMDEVELLRVRRPRLDRAGTIRRLEEGIVRGS